MFNCYDEQITIQDERSMILNLPCECGNSSKINALVDFGANINLMSYSFYKKLDVSNLKSTRTKIHMENLLVTYLEGIVEDLLVKVGKSGFPIDFVVLDMEEDDNIPIILRRPFLSTTRALVNVKDPKLTIKSGFRRDNI